MQGPSRWCRSGARFPPLSGLALRRPWARDAPGLRLSTPPVLLLIPEAGEDKASAEGIYSGLRRTSSVLKGFTGLCNSPGHSPERSHLSEDTQ